MNQLARRNFLQLMALQLSVGSLPLLFNAKTEAASASSLAKSSFDVPQSIGKAFRRKAASSPREKQIEELFLKGLPQSEVQAQLQKMIDKDLLNNSCFSYNSWILTDTEGALCLLMS